MEFISDPKFWQVNQIVLEPLKVEHVTAMIQDLFQESDTLCAKEFAVWVCSKTGVYTILFKY